MSKEQGIIDAAVEVAVFSKRNSYPREGTPEFFEYAEKLDALCTAIGAVYPSFNRNVQGGAGYGGHREATTVAEAEEAMKVAKQLRAVQAAGVLPPPGKKNSTATPSGSDQDGVGDGEVQNHTPLTGQDILEYRTRRKLTQEQLAERLGVRQATVSDLENGTVNLSPLAEKSFQAMVWMERANAEADRLSAALKEVEELKEIRGFVQPMPGQSIIGVIKADTQDKRRENAALRGELVAMGTICAKQRDALEKLKVAWPFYVNSPGAPIAATAQMDAACQMAIEALALTQADVQDRLKELEADKARAHELLRRAISFMKSKRVVVLRSEPDEQFGVSFMESWDETIRLSEEILNGKGGA